MSGVAIVSEIYMRQRYKLSLKALLIIDTFVPLVRYRVKSTRAICKCNDRGKIDATSAFKAQTPTICPLPEEYRREILQEIEWIQIMLRESAFWNLQ